MTHTVFVTKYMHVSDISCIEYLRIWRLTYTHVKLNTLVNTQSPVKLFRFATQLTQGRKDCTCFIARMTC